ncbi:hypothetical protein PIB30_092934 [Stylosanthes scabra]|uniref:Replication protein A 70 kDa DNA-binding subunit B/D first OB fold domain-containing protein n=1 Tax=Stylosanthes scabra TaxID=79078 RepID=A0ABU6RVF7_9FABA|nr:hypothetical protein [Stylosanthes scabra]
MAEAQPLVQAHNNYDKVANINPSRLNWNLLVCVVMMYELPIPSNPSDSYQGDRIQCSVPKDSFGIFKTLIREFGIYNMTEFIVQKPGKGICTTSHNIRLSFYRRTSVRKAPMDAFPFIPFHITPFPGGCDYDWCPPIPLDR